MRRLMLRRSAAVALAIASLGVSACGAEEGQKDDVAAAESEAMYRNLSGLKYQVQLSRQLNPEDPTDKAYFTNIAAGEASLPKGSVWFGVFLRVENETDRPAPSARELSVEDTQGNEFEPVESENTFAYRPVEIPGQGFLPNPEELQAQSGAGGSLLLFKIPNASLDNRPLELTVKSPQDPARVARFDLDV
jgi:hypothetical protein